MSPRRIAASLLAAALAAIVPCAAPAATEDDPHYQPVKSLAPSTFTVATPSGSGIARYFGTGSLDGNATATRALINVHGLLRNGDVYERTGEAAIAARLGDRSRFPALRDIALVGFSAGGQLVQRYAIVGRPATAVRYVVSDPSSYLWFDAQRPEPAIAASCPGFNAFKYGVEKPPPYVTTPVTLLEAPYMQRRVTYLLGQADTDPRRLARGRNYVAYLRARHHDHTNQNVAEAAGIAHDANAMFTSACGIAVLFDRPRSACAATGTI